MSFRNWSLEERERYAYITDSPVAPLLAAALDGDESMASKFEEEKHDLEGRIDDLMGENAKLESTLNQIRTLCAVTR